MTSKSIGDAEQAFSSELETEQISLVLVGQLLVTFHESPSTALDPVIERLQRGNQRIRQLGSEYLAWAVMDVVVDHYFL
ncbi:MAG: magnesium transporter [Verrucomicrobiales bacterium]|jgi:magnesium transporter